MTVEDLEFPMGGGVPIPKVKGPTYYFGHFFSVCGSKQIFGVELTWLYWIKTSVKNTGHV